MRMRTLKESYPDIPRDWETILFDDLEVLGGDEHGLFYYEDENLLVEVYHHWDDRKLDVRVYAGDNTAHGELIAKESYLSNSADYYSILSDVTSCIDDIYEKLEDYGLGSIYQVLDKTCSIREDFKDIISRKL